MPIDSGLKEVILPDKEWRLYVEGAPTHRLLFDRALEDLTMWWCVETSKTLIGTEALQKKTKFSPVAFEGLRLFMGLYPEWPAGCYMNLAPKERRRRLNILFGDNSLAIEPSLNEIPRDLYSRIIWQKLSGGPAGAQGKGPVDLILIKVPRLLPAEHRNKLVTDYLNLIYPIPHEDEIRLNGKSGPYHRRKFELELLGRYRLFAANGFNLERTKLAAGLDLRSSGRTFSASRKFVHGLIPKRWEIFEPYLRLLRGMPLIRQ